MPHALIKTLTYSLMHLTVAILVAFALTRNWAIALGIGLIEPFFQTIAYAVHERLWEKAVPRCNPAVPPIHGSSPTVLLDDQQASRTAPPFATAT